ncbi:hypothetical protein [Persicitalea jodogahamensis]|uniref:Uncharacterized protein n=1 Tax=Persicitalea jodogahamensis TaxID=402147 RepID=A0A8J3D734_9BACT|nr:hypothetical protein [Persicitalea jodogahamensis]GHB60069.1 hypothetical protein GCM10007390_12230 [Persicitalea jodogahamensis]
MKAIFCGLLLFLAVAGPGRAQDHYDPAKALSSEELFLKQYNNKRVFTKAGERYLALDASPMLGAFHRYRYFPGDQIRFKVKGVPQRMRKEIYTVTDSSFTFSYVNQLERRMEVEEILLGDIQKIKTFRRIPWVTEGSAILPLAGLIFIGADFFNKGLDGQRFTTDAKTLAIGGALAATGFICYKFSFSSVKINGHNRIKVLKTY